MKILALESSGKVAGIAIWGDSRVLCEHYLDNGLTHSQTLMPMVQSSLDSLGMRCSDIDAVAVDVGPGSFTGVRIGVCSANAIAAAIGAPVIPVNSLEVLAVNATGFEGYISSIISARSDRIYSALYKPQDPKTQGELELDGELSAGDISGWIEVTLKPIDSGNIMFVGDGALLHRAELAEALGARARFVPDYLNCPRAGAVAHIAANSEIRIKSAVPLYLRESQAERMKSFA